MTAARCAMVGGALYAVVTFDGVGHFVQAEAPDRYAELVSRFVCERASSQT